MPGVNGIVIEQIYGDNTGGAEFDTDGDGAATQEDEFVSVMNTSGAAVDLSGMQIWSDAIIYSAGDADNPDGNNGLYHTFPPGTVLQPGETLYVITEITGTPAFNMQEASEGGVESAPGSGASTNFLSEGGGANATEALALVDPSSGDYIVVNLSENAAVHVDNTSIGAFSAFPGTNLLKTYNAADESMNEDMNAGSSFQYDVSNDEFTYGAVSVTCFVAGTRIATKTGLRAVETLATGDLIATLDHGLQPVRMILRQEVFFGGPGEAKERPIVFAAGVFGAGRPFDTLRLSPQHRVLTTLEMAGQVLCPAKTFVRGGLAKTDDAASRVQYHQLVFARHEVLLAEGVAVESFYPGRFVRRRMHPARKAAIDALYPGLKDGHLPPPARPLWGASKAARWLFERRALPA